MMTRPEMGKLNEFNRSQEQIEKDLEVIGYGI